MHFRIRNLSVGAWHLRAGSSFLRCRSAEGEPDETGNWFLVRKCSALARPLRVLNFDSYLQALSVVTIRHFDVMLGSLGALAENHNKK